MLCAKSCSFLKPRLKSRFAYFQSTYSVKETIASSLTLQTEIILDLKSGKKC